LSKSELRVGCELEEYRLVGANYSKFWDLYWGVSEICHAFVNLASFTHGIAMTLVLDGFIDPHGTHEKIVTSYPDLKAAFLPPFPFAFKTAIENWRVRFALHDLASTLVRTNLAPTHCAHAVETIAKAILPTGKPDQQWATMQKQLRCSKKYLTFITDVSKVPRHGGLPNHSMSEIWESRRRAWVVVNRYLEFLHRGGVSPLPDAEFPIL
jgi:hypothetical protein